MENKVKIFENPQFGEIRTSGSSEEPMFCLADICKVLELQPSSTKNRLKKDFAHLDICSNSKLKEIDCNVMELDETLIKVLPTAYTSYLKAVTNNDRPTNN